MFPTHATGGARVLFLLRALHIGLLLPQLKVQLPLLFIRRAPSRCLASGWVWVTGHMTTIFCEFE